MTMTRRGEKENGQFSDIKVDELIRNFNKNYGKMGIGMEKGGINGTIKVNGKDDEGYKRNKLIIKGEENP